MWEEEDWLCVLESVCQPWCVFSRGNNTLNVKVTMSPPVPGVCSLLEGGLRREANFEAEDCWYTAGAVNTGLTTVRCLEDFTYRLQVEKIGDLWLPVFGCTSKSRAA